MRVRCGVVRCSVCVGGRSGSVGSVEVWRNVMTWLCDGTEDVWL